jgi:hypothetical protein
MTSALTFIYLGFGLFCIIVFACIAISEHVNRSRVA